MAEHAERDALRIEYLHRVCAALGEYLAAGHSMHIHSDGGGESLDITFTIDAPDTFHALMEADTSRSSPGTPSTGGSIRESA